MSNPQQLKQQFLQAEQFLQENKIPIPETTKLKLYGLTKQCKEGDCKMPMPPSSNTILRAKWEAWTSFSGLSTEKAMQEFISTVESLEGHPNRGNSPKGEIAPGGIRKKGILYKQRDVFKGWRARHFVLQDVFLHYYLEPDDAVPRGTMDLTGCSVTSIKSTTVDNVEYFPFVITHPKSNTTYNLSSDSKHEADKWIAAIIEAASTPETVTTTHAQPVDRLLERRVPDNLRSDDDVVANKDVVNSVLTLAGIPKKYAGKIEKAMEAMLDAVSPQSEGWEPLFEKSNIQAFKRAGDVICVRGDSVLQYSLLDVFELIMNVERQTEIDPMQKQHIILKKFSSHTWCEYISFKGVWPTSPRDFTNIIHWRQMVDGTIIIAGFSEKLEDLRPLEPGNVRGELILGGYVLRAVAGGTSVSFVIQTDLKGTLPTAVVNVVSAQQPMIVYNVRKLLEQDKKKGGGVQRKLNAPASYQELLAIASKGGGKGDDGNEIAEIFGDPSNGVPSASSSNNNNANNNNTTSAAGGNKKSKKNANNKDTLSTPKKRSPYDSKLNTVALLILFLPPLLYFVVDGQYRSIAFIGGLLIAFKYLIHLHLGEPLVRPSSIHNASEETSIVSSLPSSKTILRFPVDLGKLLIFLESKRQESELEITITHIVLKAVALAIAENPLLNGYIIMGSFYKARAPGVDMGITFEVSEKETVVLKIEDADAKPVECITDEIQTRGQALRKRKPAEKESFKTKILAILPKSFSTEIEKFLTFLGSQFGMSVPSLGIYKFPLGVCTVVTSPNPDGENDADVAVVPTLTDSSTPITVTIGGIRILPSIDAQRQVTGTPVLNFAVTIDSRAASVADARKFTGRIQQFLNEPSLLDKADQAAAYEREEAAKRKSMFG